MSRVDTLRRTRDSYAVKLQEFLKVSSKRPDAYCVFFEGADSKYYAHRIELLCPDLPWHGINSGGKDNVIKLFKLISEHSVHSKLKTLYFIDRDFDETHELPSGNCVYVTPCYSIENLFVNEAAFRRILLHEFGVNEFAEHDDSFERCLDAFNRALADYTDSLAKLNGWMLLQRRHEKANPGTTRVNLNSINIAKITHIQLDSSTAEYSLEEIERATSASLKITSEQALSAISSIPLVDRISKFRGKYQAHFLRVYIAKLVEDANAASPRLFSSRRSVHVACSEKNLISEFSQYADTPLCLRLFLQRIASTQASE